MNFEEWLAEKLTVPNQDESKGRMRHSLPQIRDFEAFTKDLGENGIKMSTKLLRPGDLAPTQSNFNEEKVDSMIAEGGWEKKPIISSSDQFVVDGHHRWLAAAKTKMPVKSRVVDMSCDDLLKFLKDKPYCEKVGINH